MRLQGCNVSGDNWIYFVNLHTEKGRQTADVPRCATNRPHFAFKGHRWHRGTAPAGGLCDN